MKTTSVDHTCEFLIIGAGPTGLGAAYRLNELGSKDWMIVEASPFVGGLARSITDRNGFLWDVGGHVQFSHYEYFDRLMERAIPRSEWFEHERESWVWLQNRFVPYPFQNNLKYLPQDQIWNCLKGLFSASRQAAGVPTNFHDWILACFGRGVADLFMLPYNFKVWATPASSMSYQWIGERVSVPDFERVLGNVILDREDRSWGPNNVFRFPKRGGTGAIWESVANLVGRSKIRLERKIVKIDAEARIATCDDGSRIAFRKCLSTMPLDLLTEIVSNCSASIRHQANQLVHSSTNVVGVGLKGSIPSHLNKKCWMYFPEDDSPFYRATVFSHYSPNNVPDPKQQWSIMLETSESKHKPVNHDKLIQDTIRGLVATRLISSDELVLGTNSFRFEYGYPVPSLTRDQILSEVLPYFDAQNIFSRGRFGAWKYEVSNQDHSLMQGVEWADRMINGLEELTVNKKAGLGGLVPIRQLGGVTRE